jgi:hypothetical protein
MVGRIQQWLIEKAQDWLVDKFFDKLNVSRVVRAILMMDGLQVVRMLLAKYGLAQFSNYVVLLSLL